METFWAPFFRNGLRMYLSRVPGQRATPMEVDVDLPGGPSSVGEALVRALGADDVGRVVDALGMQAEVEKIDGPYVVLNITGPVPGYAER